jgi:hypothetical protein
MTDADDVFDGAFAMLDVLGMGERLRTRTAADLRDNVIGAVVSAATLAGVVVNVDRERMRRGEKSKRGSLEWACFSDTIVLWLRTIDEPPAQTVESMIYTCQLLIACGMWLDLPLRGAIAYGECSVSTDPIFYVGRPIIEAHEAEAAQEWAGAILCQSAVDAHGKFTNGTRVVEYPVPIKRRGDVPYLAVNWPACSDNPSMQRSDSAGGALPGPSPAWENCFPNAEGQVALKRDATRKFFEQYGKGGGGATVGPEQRDEVKDWRKKYAAGRG